MVFSFTSLNTPRQWRRVPFNSGTGNGEEWASHRDNTLYLFSSHNTHPHTWNRENTYFVFYQKMELKDQRGEYLLQVTQWKHPTAGLEIRYHFPSQGSGLTLYYLGGRGYWHGFRRVCYSHPRPRKQHPGMERIDQKSILTLRNAMPTD